MLRITALRTMRAAQEWSVPQCLQVFAPKQQTNEIAFGLPRHPRCGRTKAPPQKSKKCILLLYSIFSLGGRLLANRQAYVSSNTTTTRVVISKSPKKSVSSLVSQVVDSGWACVSLTFCWSFITPELS